MNAPLNGRPRPMRRQYYVNKAYQSRFIAVLCVLAVAAAAAAGITVYKTAGAAIEDLMYRSHMPKGDLWQFILPPVFKTNLVIMLACFVTAVAIVMVMLVKTKRLLHALAADIQALGTSRVRQGRTAKPFGVDIHRIAGATMAEKTAFLEEAAADLLRLSQKSRQQALSGNHAAAIPTAEGLLAIVSKLETGCSQFEGSPASES